MFPGMVVQMIGVGEATGALDTMLSKIADFYEEEVDVAVEGLLTLLEPRHDCVPRRRRRRHRHRDVYADLRPDQQVDVMKERTLRRRLAVHIAVRLLVATVLLGAAVIVQVRTPGALPIDPFYFLVALTYAVSLGFIASLRFVERLPWLTDVHFAIDAIVVSAAVFITGGVESLFTILYMLPIVAASTVQFRRGGLQLAALSTILFFGVVVAQYLDANGYLATAARGPGRTDLPSGQRGAIHGRAERVWIFRGGAAERIAGRTRAARRSAARTGHRRDRRPAGVQPVRARQPAERARDRGCRQPPADVQSLGDVDYRPRRRAADRRAGAAEVLQLPATFARQPAAGPRAHPQQAARLHLSPAERHAIDLGLSVAALPLPDGSRGYLYTFQDVTDVKRFEQNARLQQRLAAVGEMAAGIAHEIRNPLASMSGSMQMLKQELPLSADQAQLMDIVLKESERLNQTIKSFLAYARPQRFSLQTLDLRPIVQETAMLLRNSTEVDDRHQIDVQAADDAVMVDADEGQIRQIIWNLATNGLRAMPNGGTLCLSASTRTRRRAAIAVLQVEDEGVGIAPEDVDSIFQPFRGSFGKGTGLGLAIVHRIVTDYGGHIDVKAARRRRHGLPHHLPRAALTRMRSGKRHEAQPPGSASRDRPGTRREAAHPDRRRRAVDARVDAAAVPARRFRSADRRRRHRRARDWWRASMSTWCSPTSACRGSTAWGC